MRIMTTRLMPSTYCFNPLFYLFKKKKNFDQADRTTIFPYNFILSFRILFFFISWGFIKGRFIYYNNGPILKAKLKRYNVFL